MGRVPHPPGSRVGMLTFPAVRKTSRPAQNIFSVGPRSPLSSEHDFSRADTDAESSRLQPLRAFPPAPTQTPQPLKKPECDPSRLPRPQRSSTQALLFFRRSELPRPEE